VIDEVEAVMREAAQTAILPLYQRLTSSDIEEKAPGDVVTVADRRAEELISKRLTAILPKSTVVGEEGVAADPSLMDRVADDGPVWVVDPLDGTANFAAGREPFAVMIALLRGGETCASWILDLSNDSLATAELGSGAYVDGVRVTSGVDSPPLSALRGVVATRYLPEPMRKAVLSNQAAIGEVLPGWGCAAREYPDVINGTQHFALFWRTLPWDHAAGVLFAHEAGAVARRLDGQPYHPADARPGLLVARNDAVWHQIHDTLLAPETGVPLKSVG
jgi:fructose-1,6-bisphosphatase/inositol monophosphatase family enzyme